VINVLGYAPEQMAGRTPFDYMEHDEAELRRKAFARHAATKEHVIDISFVI